MEYTAEHQQYRRQHQYQQAYEYGPSQFNQSAAYYAYAGQTQQRQQHYQYYPPHDSYYSQKYTHFSHEAAPIHPPDVRLDPPAHYNQPTFYYPQQPAVEPPQRQPVIPVSSLDSAVATANFVGNMDMVQRGNPPPQVQTAYRDGRRDGMPVRGGSQGHVGNRSFRPDGSALPRNRGHCHRGSRNFASKGVTSAIPNSVLDASSAAVVTPPSASVPRQAKLPAQVPAAPFLPPPRKAWCELCRVDCMIPGNLEQHKRGKRHKRNLQVHKKLQKLNKVITGQQSVQGPNSGSVVVQLEKFEGSEEKQHQEETLPLTASNDNMKESEQQKDIAHRAEASTTNPAEAKRKLRDPSGAHAPGLKRKRGRRGGKHRKSKEGPRRAVEPVKPKGCIPYMCDLCNVKCESQVAFNSHLAGKNHVANLKTFQGHQPSYGEVGLQALYPPNLDAPSPSFIPQIQQGLTDPQVVLSRLLTYALSHSQVPGSAGPQVSLPAMTLAPAQTPLSSSENQYPHQFTQGSFATSEMTQMRREENETSEAETWQHTGATTSEALPFAGNNKAESQTSESETNEVSQQQSFTAKVEVPRTGGTDVKVENGDLDSENKSVICPMDNPTTLEYLATGGEPLLSSTLEKDTRTECKTISLDAVDELGSDIDLEELEEDPEEEMEEPEEDPEEEMEEPEEDPEEIEDDPEEQNE
ncbi:hypothetical protein DITRI_Ditri13aG0019200 [Diplodiscus trichospermus]